MPSTTSRASATAIRLEWATTPAARSSSTPCEHTNLGAWEAAREEVREVILKEGWSEGVGAFTGAFGSEELDASVLMMPLVGFLPAGDPRMRATVEKIELELMWDGLVHRWAGDDNGGFLICTYWLVECLALAGEPEEATPRGATESLEVRCPRHTPTRRLGTRGVEENRKERA